MPTPTYNLRVRKEVRPALKAICDVLNAMPESAAFIMALAKSIPHEARHRSEGSAA